MRVYLNRSRADAERILQGGFQNDNVKDVKTWAHLLLDPKAEEGFFVPMGVYVYSIPMKPAKGFEDDVTLTVEIPVQVFWEYEEPDSLLMQECGYRKALIPAEALNRLGSKPEIVEMGVKVKRSRG